MRLLVLAVLVMVLVSSLACSTGGCPGTFYGENYTYTGIVLNVDSQLGQGIVKYFPDRLTVVLDEGVGTRTIVGSIDAHKLGKPQIGGNYTIQYWTLFSNCMPVEGFDVITDIQKEGN